MSGYKIADLNAKTQDLIRKQRLDKNGDGLINDDNDELANLLSKAGASSIQELSDKDMSAAYLLIGEAATGAGLSLMANHWFNAERQQVPQSEIAKRVELLLKDNANEMLAYKQYGKSAKYIVGHVPQQITRESAMAEVLKDIEKGQKNCRRMGNIFLTLSLVAGVITVFSALHARVTNKDVQYVRDESKATETEPQTIVTNKEWENKFRNAFGKDAELNEYTPKQGEYWISILKAKYGVDDVTAQKMANRIKEVIYNDPKAAKQSPIMYLPTIWTFEGKTYTYNDSVKAERAEKYSDNVKTEMGNMNKDIKY